MNAAEYVAGLSANPLCCECYPDAGPSNVYCMRHFDETHRRMNELPVAAPLHHVVQSVGNLVIPRRHHAASVDRLVADLRTVDPLRTSALIHGESDIGKSFQAACLVRRAIEYAATGCTPRVDEFMWVTTLGLIEMLIAEFGTKPKVSITQRVIEARVLVLDDIGTTRMIDDRRSDWAYGKLLDVVNSRYDEMRPIIATSNLAPGRELGERIGERILGRLMDDAAVVELRGQNRRMPRLVGRATTPDTTPLTLVEEQNHG
jgi:IstB-like ATP binding protein